MTRMQAETRANELNRNPNKPAGFSYVAELAEGRTWVVQQYKGGERGASTFYK